MNQNGDHQQWPQHEQQQFDVMGALPQEDLSNFLDFDGIDNMDFSLQDFNNNNASAQDMQLQNGHNPQQQALHNQQQPPPHDNHIHMTDAPDFSSLDLDDFSQLQPMPNQMQDFHQQQQQEAHQMMGTPSAIDFAQQAQQFQQDTSQYAMPLPNYHPHYSVPPTPNSTDVFPGSAHFPHQNGQQVMYPGHQFHPGKHDTMGMLTPFVSPQIPGGQYPVDLMTDYQMAGFAMSPLTSPALYPQNNGNHIQYSHPHTAESSLNASPIDLGIDMNLDQTPAERPRKTRKKILTPKVSAGVQKPRALAATRRKGSLTGVVDAITAEAFKPLQTHQPQLAPFEPAKSSSPQLPHGMTMAPPPKPGSADGFPINSPFLAADSSGLPAATPTSIMRIRAQAKNGSGSNTPYMSPIIQQQLDELQTPVIASLGPGMEDLRLPDAASPQENRTKKGPPRITMPDGRPTPRMLPKIASAAATPIPSSTPYAQPLQSPAIASVKGNDTKPVRNSRKRNSTHSTLASPALRPKISPSIKPLLPDGQLSNDTHALLLASKSNYQNLIEGNTLPGVNYPADLSMNLTSKRTSHKLAEQGRRNRINTALQELAGLIPSSFNITAGKDGSHSSGDGEGGSPDPVKEENGGHGKAPQTPTTAGSSKAATVEQATAYIKVLQSDKKDMEDKMKLMDQRMSRLMNEMEGLKKRLEKAEI